MLFEVRLSDSTEVADGKNLGWDFPLEIAGLARLSRVCLSNTMRYLTSQQATNSYLMISESRHSHEGFRGCFLEVEPLFACGICRCKI